MGNSEDKGKRTIVKKYSYLNQMLKKIIRLFLRLIFGNRRFILLMIKGFCIALFFHQLMYLLSEIIMIKEMR